jgi:hypothetical protein
MSGTSIETVSRGRLDPLEELKWLRSGVLAVHAMLGAYGMSDSDARAHIDLDAIAYLTEQMQTACLDGALANIITNLEREEKERSAEQRRAATVAPESLVAAVLRGAS